MFETERLPYRDTECFSELICDYLDQKPELETFYSRFPELKNFEKQIEERSGFSMEMRQILSSRLDAQYKRLRDIKIEGEKVEENILALRQGQTYTILTGHQLNIFTGPLFFIYKIISCIKLSQQLSESYPEYQFVPVYWMATEDHDLDEINHINLYGGRLTWEREAGGPVGRFSNEGFSPLIDELAEHLGPGTHNEYLTGLFRRAYEKQPTLADATRYIAHELFGKYGLVCIDGDDRELKSGFAPYMEKELSQQLAHNSVEATTHQLEELHFKQVHPRELNLFYIKDGLRERIEKRKGNWMVLNTDLSFNHQELQRELQNSPENFSPNVILRPLYQEVVLPNLAYIGGGGELAYWMQLRQLFNNSEVPFPMLILRNSVLWVKNKYHKKLDKLEIETVDLFKPLHEIQKEYVEERAPVEPSLSPYEQKIKKIFDELEEVAHLTDDSMLGAVNAQRAKQLKGLENLRKKLIRAEKRRRGDEMEQIERLYLSLFPSHGLQERHDNLSIYYSEYGPYFIETLLDILNPLDYQFTIVKETGR